MRRGGAARFTQPHPVRGEGAEITQARDSTVYFPSLRTLQMLLLNSCVRSKYLSWGADFSSPLTSAWASWSSHAPNPIWVSDHGASLPHPHTPRSPRGTHRLSLHTAHREPTFRGPFLSVPDSRPCTAQVTPLWASASDGLSSSKLPLHLLQLKHVLCWFIWPQTNGPPHRSISTSHCILELTRHPELELFYCFPSQTFKNNICPSWVSVSPHPPRWWAQRHESPRLRALSPPAPRRACRSVSAIIPDDDSPGFLWKLGY